MSILTQKEMSEIEGGRMSLSCATYLVAAGSVALVGGAALGPAAGLVAFGFMMAKSPC